MRRGPGDEDGGARGDRPFAGTRPDLASQPTMMGIRITQQDIAIDAEAKGLGPESRERHESITVTRDARSHLGLQPADPSLTSGVRNALVRGIGARADERLALISDSESLPIAAAVLREADALGLRTQPYVLGADEASNDAFLRRLGKVLSEVELSVLLTAPANPPHEDLLRCVLDTSAHARRHGHMVGVTVATMRQAMRADPDEMHRLGERLIAKMQPQSTIEVLSRPKTALTVRTKPENRWHNNAGMVVSSGWCALPGGEVYTAPSSVDGRLSPDGGVWLPNGKELDLPMRLELRFEGGELVAAEGPGADRLLAAARSVEGGTRVGRVAFGTNLSLLTPIGARSQDLRMPGVHLVLGDPDAARTGADFRCAIEIPVAVRRPDVTVDGMPVMVRGRYARDLTAA